MEESHIISGNPMRFAHGKVRVEPDDEWVRRMSRRDKAAVTAITLPLLARYGYLPFRREVPLI